MLPYLLELFKHGKATIVVPVDGVAVVANWLESHTIFHEWDQPHTVFHEQPGRIEHPGIDSVVIIAAPVVPDFFWEWPG